MPINQELLVLARNGLRSVFEKVISTSNYSGFEQFSFCLFGLTMKSCMAFSVLVTVGFGLLSVSSVSTKVLPEPQIDKATAKQKDNKKTAKTGAM